MLEEGMALVQLARNQSINLSLGKLPKRLGIRTKISTNFAIAESCKSAASVIGTRPSEDGKEKSFE
jgi:hypothetical protein